MGKTLSCKYNQAVKATCGIKAGELREDHAPNADVLCFGIVRIYYAFINFNRFLIK